MRWRGKRYNTFVPIDPDDPHAGHIAQALPGFPARIDLSVADPSIKITYIG